LDTLFFRDPLDGFLLDAPVSINERNADGADMADFQGFVLFIFSDSPERNV